MQYIHKQHQEKLSGKERRHNKGLFIPTLYLSFEALIGFLILYLVHGGGHVKEWNILFAGIVLLVFIFSCFKRYIKVLERSGVLGKRQGGALVR